MNNVYNRTFKANGCISMFFKKEINFSGFPVDSVVKESACQCRRPRFDHGSVRSPGGGNGNPLQYSCLEDPMDWGPWRAMVHRVTRSRAQLSNWAQKLFPLEWTGIKEKLELLLKLKKSPQPDTTSSSSTLLYNQISILFLNSVMKKKLFVL